MASTLHKAIKQVLKEIDTFLTSTLRDQSLNKTAQKERVKLIESLQKFYNDYADFKPIQEQDDSKSVPPNPKLASIGSQASEEADGNEDNIPQTTVAALKEPTRLGYLLQRKSGEGKQKLFKQKKDTKKYCVIHENVMYWFIKPSDKTYHGAVYLNGCEFKDLSRKEKEFVFQLDFISKNKSYEFQADNREDFDKWKNAVETGIKRAEQKEADAIDGRNTYPYEAISTPATSSKMTAGVVSYVNETTKIEDEANVYLKPVFSSNDDDKINDIEKELRSSVPRERPPSPPNPTKHDTVPLPLSKGKGKAPKESKPAKTKKNEIVATVTDKINKTLPSKIFPQNKKSPTSKPELFTEVKLKPVSMSVGKSPVGKEIVNEEEEEEDEGGAIYEIVDNSHLAAFNNKNSVSVPDSKPPELPQRGSHVYANEKDTDNLEYEL